MTAALWTLLACTPKGEAQLAPPDPQRPSQEHRAGPAEVAAGVAAAQADKTSPGISAASGAAPSADEMDEAEPDPESDAGDDGYAVAEELEQQEARELQARLDAAFAHCTAADVEMTQLRADLQTRRAAREAFFEIHVRGPWSILELTERGSGADESDQTHATAVSNTRCALGAELVTLFNGASAVGQIREPLRGPSSSARRALTAQLGLQHYRPKNPQHALASLYLGLPPRAEVELPSATLIGPEFVRPRAFDGLPQQLAAVMISPRETIARPHLDPKEPHGVLTQGGEPPVKTASFGGVDVYEAELGGPNGGVAVALYNTKRDRHRWVLETRQQLVASRITWVGLRGGLLVGETRSDHGGSKFAGTAHVVVIRLRDGAVSTLRVPGVFADGHYIGDDAEIDTSENASFACAEQAAAAEGYDDSSEEGVARIHELYEVCETSHGIPPRVAFGRAALRIRDSSSGWVEIPWDELAKAAERIRL